MRVTHMSIRPVRAKAPFCRLRHSKTIGHFHMTTSREVGYAVTHDGRLHESVGTNVVS